MSVTIPMIVTISVLPVLLLNVRVRVKGSKLKE